MPIETLNESIARAKLFNKSAHDNRERASYETNTHAVAMPIKKSAVVERMEVRLAKSSIELL